MTSGLMRPSTTRPKTSTRRSAGIARMGLTLISRTSAGTFEAVLNHLNLRARVVLCGMISQYNATEPQPGPRNLGLLISKRARMEGFIVLDYMNRADEAFSEMGKWLMEGKLKYRVDEVEGLEKAPTALNKLFEGANQGKLVVKL